MESADIGLTSSGTPRSFFPAGVVSILVGPISQLPPLGTHSPPSARPMIWCPKHMPDRIFKVSNPLYEGAVVLTDEPDLGLLVRQESHIVNKAIDPLEILICRGSYKVGCKKL